MTTMATMKTITTAPMDAAITMMVNSLLAGTEALVGVVGVVESLISMLVLLLPSFIVGWLLLPSSIVGWLLLPSSVVGWLVVKEDVTAVL